MWSFSLFRKTNKPPVVEIDIIKVDEHKDGYSDIIRKRIIEGIDSCDLLIADLSYGNKNVHHEIGSNLSMQDQLRVTTYHELREGLLKKLKIDFLCKIN